jgi:peptide/nickel transport system substrate-binding protein
VLRRLAISSVLLALALAAARAETRPRYGDTLRIETRSVAFLTPGSYGADESLSRLIYDTLVTLNANGTPDPALATSWQSTPDFRHWQFSIRRDVVFHDGRPLSADDVVVSLRAANPGWRVRSIGAAVVVEDDSAHPAMPAELANIRNAVRIRATDSTKAGTGPFKPVTTSGMRVVLQANDDYWNGRPFLDAVEITTGRSLREQAVDLDVGRADVIEASLEDVRRALSPRARYVSSQPADVLAMVFSRSRTAVQDERVRQALAVAVDRSAMQSVLLQKQGDATAALLPNWMSGYAFLFPAAQDLARARQLLGQSRPALTIGYLATDPLTRVVAERVVLNARDAGMAAQLMASSEAADVVVERIALHSSDPWAALADVADEYKLGADFKGAGWQDLYSAERDLLAAHWIVPLLAVPRVYAVGPRVHDVRLSRDGVLEIERVWAPPSAPGPAGRMP